MTDRDHFAAAALTGLLSNVQRYQNEPLTRQAFEIADFMISERGKRPEKPDSSPVTEPMPKEKRAEVSDKTEPAAWIVRTDHFQCGVAEHYETAVRWAEQTAGYIVPLYRHSQPTLTDAEREAVVRAWHGLLKLAHHEPSLIDEHLAGARALNALLERTRNG